MVSPEISNPTLVRRVLGRRLKAMREGAGKTVEDVLVSGIMSRSKLYRIESGKCAVRPGDVVMLARIYGCDPRSVDELVRFAEATRSSGFHEDFGAAVPESMGMYADLEAGADMIYEYNSELVPGLLQTAEYIEAIMDGVGFAPDVVEARVAFRLKRQRAYFDRPRPGGLEAIITAGALGVRVRSETVMQTQRQHLVALAKKDGVSVRVLPAERGIHSAMLGPFTLLDPDDPDDTPIVYLPSLIGSRYIERPDHVAQFREAFASVRAQTVSIEEYVT